MLRDLPPRHFADATVPLRPDGTPLHRADSDDDARAYIAWLAAYLVTAELPLHPRQFAYAAVTDGESPESAAFKISDDFGHAVWELGFLDQHFLNGGTWAEWQRNALAEWQNLPEAARSGQTYEEFSLGEERYAQLRAEWEEEQKLAGAAGHADIPYRALLTRILRRVPDREQRVRILDSYFRNFTDNASK